MYKNTSWESIFCKQGLQNLTYRWEKKLLQRVAKRLIVSKPGQAGTKQDKPNTDDADYTILHKSKH